MQHADLPAGAGSHGAPASDAPAELGGYRLVELLGRGGMGEVWRAEREGPGGIRRRAAVKRILPAMRGNHVLRERFLAEARTNARLEHPNIVQVLDFGDRPEPFLVLEYVEGITAAEILRDLSRANTRLPAVVAAFVAAEIATGLDYAHRKRDEQGRPLQIVHRDVSPQNILVSVEGAVKITDFGVARAADNSFRTQDGVTVGKLVYMAPEQAAGEPVDGRADVFALGVTLWEMLTLRPLLPRDDASAALQSLLRCDFAPPSRVDPRLPESVDHLVMPALARDPGARYASAGAFAQAARSFIHAIAPGFDSTEMVRILGKLLPSVAFHMPTPPARGDIPAPAAAPRARHEMPALNAVPAPAEPPVRASSPQPVPTAAMPAHAPAPMPVPMPRVYAPPPVSVPPAPPSRRLVLPIALAVVGVVVAAGAIGAAVLYKRWRVDRAAVTSIETPAPVPLTPPTTALGAFAPAPVPGAPVPGAPMPGVPVPVMPMAPAPTPPAPAPVTRSAVAPRTSGTNRNAQQGPTTPGQTSAVRAIQRQLAPLRGLVGACLGASAAPGTRVRVTVLYDGRHNVVDHVQTSATGLAVEPEEGQCVLSTIRDAVHVDGVEGEITVHYEYEF